MVKSELAKLAKGGKAAHDRRKDMYKKEERTGKSWTFWCSLNNAHALIDGTQIVCVLDKSRMVEWKDGKRIDRENKSGDQAGEAVAPRVVIQLDYLNSIYTRKGGEGELSLLIKSWTSGNGANMQALPSSTYARVKLYDHDNNEEK